MKLTDLRGNRVLITPLEEVNESKIILTQGTKDTPITGRVEMVGSGRITPEGNTVPIALEVGTIVLFSKYSGQEITVEGEKKLLMADDSIIGIVDPASVNVKPAVDFLA